MWIIRGVADDASRRGTVAYQQQSREDIKPLPSSFAFGQLDFPERQYSNGTAADSVGWYSTVQ